MARHQLRPLFDQVVITELEPDRMRKSGLVVSTLEDRRHQERPW